MRKFLFPLVVFVVAVGAACDDGQTSTRPDAVTYDVPPTTAGDPDGPAIDRQALPHFPASGSAQMGAEPADRVSYEDSDPGRDADTRGNYRYDPDTFDCNVDGNGRCDETGIPVNGPDGGAGYHADLPCYLDFPAVANMSDEQYDNAHALWCEATDR